MQPSMKKNYGDVRTTQLSFLETVEQLESALKKEGFGVLCHIDIQAKMKEKLGIDFSKYVILGACNPLLARLALQGDMNLGLLLPCNTVVYEAGGQIHVGVIDAIRMLSVADIPGMEGLARQVNEKLQRALDAVAARPAV
ncbi:MAG: DUF302 domain-containing protein [Candidatus Acidiferrales bacterium]